LFDADREGTLIHRMALKGVGWGSFEKSTWGSEREVGGATVKQRK